MTLRYFAYGSNMHPGRLLTRINSAVVVGVARLPQHRLAFHKRGADGSGKGNIVAAAGAEVWGVVYSVNVADAAVLDRIEGPGYSRVDLEVVQTESGENVSAFSYRARARAIADDLHPFSWYLDFLLHGAAHHGLPDHYLEQLRRVAAIADADSERARLAGSLLDRW